MYSAGRTQMNENIEYKIDTFSMMMEDKRNALKVYNVLNHTIYTASE